MQVLGLTGSIGMGKSTIAQMFADEGLAVWDADAAVARLYRPGGAGVAAIAALAPDCLTDGPGGPLVERAALRARVTGDPALIGRIETVIHPLVAQDRARFLDRARAGGAARALCDVPLLFETGGEAAFDAVIVVSAPPETQRARVLARPGMTEATLATILGKQMPDAQKRARADFVIDTGAGLDAARARVREILAAMDAGRMSERNFAGESRSDA